MKFIVVIAITICSVTVLGVLIGLQQFVTNQAQIVLDEFNVKQKLEIISNIQPIITSQNCFDDNCIAQKNLSKFLGFYHYSLIKIFENMRDKNNRWTIEIFKYLTY